MMTQITNTLLYQSSSISLSEYVAVLWSAKATASVQPTAMNTVHRMSIPPGFSPTTNGACTMLITSVDAASGASSDCAAKPSAAKSAIEPSAIKMYPTHEIGRR